MVEKISDEAIQGIQKDIDTEIERSWTNTGINNSWNVRFRVALLFIGIGIVVCSSIAASQFAGWTKEYWSVLSAILGGASTALAAFAFNQFNFESRQRIWLDRHSALKVVRDRILIGERDPKLLEDIAIVRSWHDFNPPAGDTFRRLLGSHRVDHILPGEEQEVAINGDKGQGDAISNAGGSSSHVPGSNDEVNPKQSGAKSKTAARSPESATSAKRAPARQDGAAPPL